MDPHILCPLIRTGGVLNFGRLSEHRAGTTVDPALMRSPSAFLALGKAPQRMLGRANVRQGHPFAASSLTLLSTRLCSRRPLQRPHLRPLPSHRSRSAPCLRLTRWPAPDTPFCYARLFRMALASGGCGGSFYHSRDAARFRFEAASANLSIAMGSFSYRQHHLL